MSGASTDGLTALASIFESNYFYAVLLGLCLGVAELMGRYRDDPVSIFQAIAAWFYVGVNGALAALSLYMIQELGLSFTPEDTGGGATATDRAAHIYDVMAAGFGGAAFFRSSVMKTKVGDTDVSIGPAIVIDTLLKVTDREVDRFRAERRAEQIASLMSNINLNQASGLVLPFCTALMQNVSAAERESLLKEARAFATDSTIDSRTKPMVLALRLVNLVGFGVLKSAVDELRNQKLLGDPQQDEGQTTSPLIDLISRSFSARKGRAPADPAEKLAAAAAAANAGAGTGAQPGNGVTGGRSGQPGAAAGGGDGDAGADATPDTGRREPPAG